MDSWFVPPIVVPLGLVAIILAAAIYHASTVAPPRPRAVAVGQPAAALPPADAQRGARP